MSNVGICTLQYRIRHLDFEITVCEVNWIQIQFLQLGRFLIPGFSVEDLATYGEAEVECLVQHFRLASFGEE